MWHWLVYVGMWIVEVSLEDLPSYLEKCRISNQYLTDVINGEGTYDGETFRVEVCLSDSESYRYYLDHF